MGFLSCIADPFEQIAHPAFGIRDIKLFFDPGAHLLGALKPMGVEFGFELSDLVFAQKAVGAASFQTAERVYAAAVIEPEPVGDGIGNYQKYLRDFAVGMASVFEKQTVKPFPEAGVLFLFVAAGDFFPLRVGEGKA